MPAATSTTASTTSPITQKGAVALKGIATGTASKYWLELVSLPPGNNNRLWLFVNGTWTFLGGTTLNGTTAGLQAAVQNAFNSGSNLQVSVWYDTSSNAIVGLVVRS